MGSRCSGCSFLGRMIMKKILFIGNSFTYFNNMPFILQQLAAAAGTEVYTRMVAYGGFHLADYLDMENTAHAEVMEALFSSGWDAVVLQEQSHTPYTNKPAFIDSVDKWSKLIEGTCPGAAVYLYQTWSYKEGSGLLLETITDTDYTGCAGSANLIYIPTASELSAMPFKDDANRAAYEKFISGDKYLSKHRGEYATRGGAILPWFNNVSAKVSQDFIFNIAGRDHTLRLGVDMNNIGNLLNPAWGNAKQIQSTSAISLKDGVYTFNADQCKFNTYAGSISTWSILFSARYFF